ncbi:MAG: zf-HC2 domain-containing protein [Candidatus Acidiferrales bacterium]
MNWNCQEVEAKLSEYLDGELSAADEAGCAEHIAGCEHCRELAASVRGLVGAMHAIEPVEIPLRLVPAILERTLGPKTEARGWRAWFGWLRPVWQPRFAYGALTVMLTVMVLSQALGIQWRKPTLADLNPVNIYRAVDREAHLAYARGAKYFGDLRVVYEIESKLRSVEPEQQKTPASRPGSPGKSEGPSNKPLDLNRADFGRGHRTRLASILSPAALRSIL